MHQISFVYFTDPHIWETTPKSRKDAYYETVCGKVSEVIGVANDLQATLLHGGDLFHHHYAPPSVVQRVAHLLSTCNQDIYSVIGNHDIFGHNPSALSNVQLGILEATGVLHMLTKETPTQLHYDINGQDFIIQLSGVSYHANMDADASDYHVKKVYQNMPAIHIVHGYLVNKPWPRHGGFTLVSDVKTEADVILTGHEHQGFGVHQERGKFFCNPGALSRVHASLAEVKRWPQYVIIRVDVYDDLSWKLDVSCHRLKCAQPGEAILDREAIEEMQKRNKRLQNFNQAISEQNLEINLLDILESTATMQNIPKEVKAEALRRILETEESLISKRKE